MKLKNLTRISVLACVSLIIFVLESQMPPLVPIAGVKLGLANVVVLYAMTTIDIKAGFFVLLAKVLLGNLFAGTAVSMFYSLMGGALCFVAQWLMMKVTDEKQLWAVSVVGAVFHNIGQVIAAVILTGTEKIVWYLMILVPVGIITGAFVGIVVTYTKKAIENVSFKRE